MAKAANAYSERIPERRPGDFRRHPRTGAPYVAHPTNTTKRTGTKAELIAECAAAGIEVPVKATVAVLQELLGPRPAFVQYGRPSSLGKQIENQTNLQKWSERMVALGVGRDEQLRHAAADLAALEPDSNEFREAADAIARRAKTAAQAHIGAERGTHHHELTDDVDNDRDPVIRMAAGEDLGVPVASQRALLVAWGAMLATFDIEILATEASCVDDVWQQAGTLDRVCRLRRALRFVTVTGEFVELPAGWVGILDIKTGQLRLDRNGFVAYWHGYSVQLASYAQSRPYCTDTDTRGEWPWPIDQRWAIIAHLDVLAALDGEAVCRLVLVDLEAGRAAGALCVAAKEWEKRADVFSIPVDELAVRVPVDHQNASGSGIDYPVEPDAPTSVAPPVAIESTLTASAADSVPSEGPGSAQPTPAPRTPHDEQEAIRSRPAPDDGDPVVDPAYDVLEREYLALDAEGRAWITALTEQATRAGVSFHSRGHRTERRYSIIRGLVLLAANSATIDDDLVRALLEGVIGHVAQFQSVPVGQLVGSLTAREAHDFADLCDRFAAGQFGLTVDDDGATHLRAAA